MNQAALAAAVMLAFVGLDALISLSGEGLGERWAYQAVATSLMLYAVANALLSLQAESINRYWTASILSYGVLAAVGIGLAFLYSGLWITEAGSYRWIFMVLTFGYGVLLSIVALMKGIVSFAEREEWTEPRKRGGG